MRKDFFVSLASKLNLKVYYSITFFQYRLGDRVGDRRININVGIKRKTVTITIFHEVKLNSSFQIESPIKYTGIDVVETYYLKFDRIFQCILRGHVLSADKSVDRDALLNIVDKNMRKRLLNLKSQVQLIKITNKKIVIKTDISSDNDHEKIISLINEIDIISKIFENEIYKKSDLIAIEKDKHEKDILIENLKGQIDPEYRLKCLHKLIPFAMFDKKIELAIIEALNDENIEVQISAAKNTGEKGLKHIEKLLKSSESLTGKQVYDLLNHVDKHNHKISIKTLKKRLRESKNETTVVLILQLMYANWDENISNFLIDELKNRDENIGKFILDILASAGSLKDIESLKLYSKSHPKLMKYISEVIIKIKTRNGVKPEKGWLSFEKISDKDGALSINDEAEEGALSVDDGE